MLVSGQCECSTKSQAMKCGVDGYNEYLANRRCLFVMNFGPTEGGNPIVAFVDQESLCIEPRLSLVLRALLDCPAALLAMPGECPIVDFAPLSFVLANNKGSCRYISCLFQRNRTLHAKKISLGLEAKPANKQISIFSWVVYPQRHPGRWGSQHIS